LYKNFLLGAGIEYKDLELNPLDNTNQFIEKSIW
jgi:hypothetical protein